MGFSGRAIINPSWPSTTYARKMENILNYFYEIKEWYQTTDNKKLSFIRNFFDRNESIKAVILWCSIILLSPLIVPLLASVMMALIIGIPIFIPLDKYIANRKIFNMIAIPIFVVLTIICGCVIIYLQVQYDIFWIYIK